MLTIYDQNGTVITKDTKKEDIVGNLNFIDVTVPNNKILNRIDVKVTPNIPVFIDIPKTEMELTQEQIQKIIPQLTKMDIIQGINIKELKDLTKTLEFRINQLEAKIGGIN